MKAINKDEFYAQYLPGKSTNNDFIGYFDFLEWDSLKENIDQCNIPQRKLFYKIILMNGEAQYNCNGYVNNISGKTIVFIHPLIKSSFYSADNEFSAKYCMFNDSFLNGTSKFKLMNFPLFSTNNVYIQNLSEERYRYLLSRFREIKDECNSSYEFKEQLIQNKIFDIIHYVLKLNDNKTISDVYPKQELLQSFFNLLENRFSNIDLQNPLLDKSPSHFAIQLHTTVDYLNKTIKSQTGKTTNTFIQARIIEEANVFLRYTQYSIKELALCLNFKETSHFINFYKKHTKLTPQEYRSK